MKWLRAPESEGCMWGRGWSQSHWGEEEAAKSTSPRALFFVIPTPRSRPPGASEFEGFAHARSEWLADAAVGHRASGRHGLVLRRGGAGRGEPQNGGERLRH